MENNKTFISYSWDSEEHKEWVLQLANELRRNGIDATIDRFETQKGTTHLAEMMTRNIRDSNYTVIVLTEKYAERADLAKGGVGFETKLTMPLIMDNPNKLIFVLRHKSDFIRAFPFHFNGHYAIDFSDDTLYKEKLNELVKRIYRQPLVHVEQLGDKPNFNHLSSVIENSTDLNNQTNDNNDSSGSFNFDVMGLRRVTDIEIDNFMKNNYREIVENFKQYFYEVKKIRSEFDFIHNEINNFKTIFDIYDNGMKLTAIKIWYGNAFGANSIKMLYGQHNEDSDHSMNEIITHEINDKKELKMKMTMDYATVQQSVTAKDVVEKVASSQIKPLLDRNR